jgi:hypothetical protein
MTWWLVFGVVAAFLALWRIYSNVRKLRGKRDESWDAKGIERLRARGVDPFKPYEVKFFFALPSEAACHAINAQLEAEGCAVNIQTVPENPDFPFNLHATKAMRLSVPDMQDLSRRYVELARLHGGRYDGWL